MLCVNLISILPRLTHFIHRQSLIVIINCDYQMPFNQKAFVLFDIKNLSPQKMTTSKA